MFPCSILVIRTPFGFNTFHLFVFLSTIPFVFNKSRVLSFTEKIPVQLFYKNLYKIFLNLGFCPSFVVNFTKMFNFYNQFCFHFPSYLQIQLLQSNLCLVSIPLYFLFFFFFSCVIPVINFSRSQINCRHQTSPCQSHRDNTITDNSNEYIIVFVIGCKELSKVARSWTRFQDWMLQDKIVGNFDVYSICQYYSNN